MLPEPCDDCAPYGGKFCRRGGGMARCGCARGQILAQLDDQRGRPVLVNVEPKITERTATLCVSMMSGIKYFPSESAARLIIADELQSMCNSDEEAFATAKQMGKLFEEWPGGIRALRAVFCSMYFPLDRDTSVLTCAEYPDGIPATRTVEEPFVRLLAPELTEPIKMIAEACDLNAHLREIKGSPSQLKIPSTPQILTQADIDAAVAKLHGKIPDEHS